MVLARTFHMEQPKVDILVVDDNPANLVAVEAILNELGENVVKAASGAEALRRLLTQEFALIILDVQMPDMDGYETAHLIRERDKTRATPIIFLTAYDRSEAHVLRAYELGAVDFLHKPIIPTILKSKAQVFVELFRKTIEVKRQSTVLRDIEKKEHDRVLVGARQKWEAEKLRTEMEQSQRAAEAIAVKATELARTVGERERAEEALRQSNQRLRLLSETATRLLHGARPRDLIISLFDQISAHLGLEVELGFTVENGAENGGGLVLDSWAGLDEEIVRGRAAHIIGEVCDRVAGERRRLIAESLSVSDRFPALRELGVEAFVCYPLLAQGRLMGTLIFGTRRRPTFEIDELAVMQVFCDQVAVAMERARLLVELERRNKELAESDKRKDEFLAMLGHEIRNPLAPMMTALQLMRLHGDEDPTVIKAHKAMDRQLRHIVRLVDDLLDVSRITSGKIELRREPTDLASIIEHGLATSRPLLADRGHTLHLHAPVETVEILVDATRLSQVISNLLNNAAKYTPPGGNVWLAVAVDGHDATISVRDDGIGIPAEEMARVFELFVQSRSQAQTDRIHGGLGIGLTLVKRLVELHGGVVRGFSAGIGKGSEFVVRLPGAVIRSEPRLADGSPMLATSITDSSPHPTMTPMSPLRIVVVEDNDDIRETLKDLLVMCGHEVDVAEDGERGVQMVLDQNPDIALIDIGLPGLDGYNVARALRDRQSDPQTRLIALTGYGQPDDRKKALDAGFDAHLVKPVDLERLSKVLAEQTA